MVLICISLMANDVETFCISCCFNYLFLCQSSVLTMCQVPKYMSVPESNLIVSWAYNIHTVVIRTNQWFTAWSLD